MGRRRLLPLVAACVAALLTAVSCTSSSESSTKEGGVLRIGTGQGIDSLNPFVAIEQDGYNTWDQIYPELVQYDLKTLDFVPDFASEWQESEDGLTWTFHTRPNAKWSDAEPLTADDVAWTINTIIKFKSGPTGAFGGTVSYMKSAEATSPTTVVLRYSRPVANALSNMQQIPILPEHVWSRYATGTGHAIRTYPNTPSEGKPLVTGGTFFITQYKKNDVTLFERNPYFYGQKPHIDGYGLQYFSNDDAMVQALKTGQIDAIESLPVTSVQTIKDAGFHVYVGPSLYFRTLIINTNPNKTEHRELLDPRVREAFEYAIDRDQIVKTAWLGYAAEGTTIVPPAAGNWHDSSIEPLPFDTAKANELLDQAGYARGPDGVRVADGHKMEYDVIFPTDERGPGDRAFLIIQSGLRDIGVVVKQKTMDATAAFNAISAPDNKYLDFDLAMWYWVPLIDPDFILSVMMCKQYGIWSDSGYCNPAYDKLYDQQSATLNQQDRLQIAYQMQKMVYEDRPYIVLNYNDTIDAWSNQWTGFVESPQGMITQLSKASLQSVHLTS